MDIDEANYLVYSLYLHDDDSSVYTIIECAMADCSLNKVYTFETWASNLKIYDSSFSSG